MNGTGVTSCLFRNDIPSHGSVSAAVLRRRRRRRRRRPHLLPCTEPHRQRRGGASRAALAWGVQGAALPGAVEPQCPPPARPCPAACSAPCRLLRERSLDAPASMGQPWPPGHGKVAAGPGREPWDPGSWALACLLAARGCWVPRDARPPPGSLLKATESGLRGSPLNVDCSEAASAPLPPPLGSPPSAERHRSCLSHVCLKLSRGGSSLRGTDAPSPPVLF